VTTRLTRFGWWTGHFRLKPVHLGMYGAAIAVFLLGLAVLVPPVRASALVQLLVVESTVGVAWLVLRAGHERAAAAVAIGAGWLIAAAGALATGGVTGASYAGFAVNLVLAGLLMGPGGAVTVAALSLGLGLVASAGNPAIPWLVHGVAPPSPTMVRVVFGYLFIILAMAVALGEMRVALRANAEALSLVQATLESTADGILVVDAEGRVVGHNQKFLDLWRIPPELAGARDDERLITYVLDQLRDPKSFTEKVRQLYAQNYGVSFDVLEFLDGRLYERYSQPQMRDGEPVGRVWSFRDVTDRRRAEVTRRRLEEELFQAQKMEALGRLAGGIAHDFNNILTAIVSYTEIARLDAGDQPAILDSLDEVLRASKRARDLVNQILIFSRTRAQERVPLRLRPVVAEALQLLGSSLPKGLQVSFEPAGEDRVVLADPTQIHQVVMNLGINAGQAMGQNGGQLTVRLEPSSVAAGAAAPAPGLAPGEYMVLTVHDDGPGMDAQTVARIYEPFFSTKAPGKGTGLGLAMVHTIVRNHHGGIEVESAPGGGTTFRVYFPVETEAARDGAGRRAARSGAPGGQRVLLVDDEPRIAGAARVLLERVGYRVEIETDAATALARFTGDPGAFDALITDLHLPGMSGFDLVARVHALSPGLPIIVATGSPRGLPGERSLGPGVTSVVEKPYTIAALASALERALRTVES
jgi:signal transduction histidine kinase